MLGKKVKIILVLVFILPFLLAAYMPHIVKTADMPEHLEDLTKQEALEDYDYFWSCIKKYHTSIMATHSPEEIEEIEAECRQDIENPYPGSSTAEALTEAILKVRRELSYMGHLQLISGDLYDEGEGTFMVPFEERINMGTPDYSEMFSDERVRESAYWYEETYMGTKGGTGGGDVYPEFEHIDGKISYIKLPSFANSYIERDHDDIASWLKEHINDEAIILDIRGNGGGNGMYWYSNILAYLLNEDVMNTSYGFISDFPEDPDCAFMEDIREKASPEEREMVYSLPGFEPGPVLDEALLYKSTTMWPKDEENCLGYEGKIYLLTDGGTGSAAAGLAYFCKVSGFATIVGKTTNADSGSGFGISPVWFTLPNSRLPFMIRLSYSVMPDGSCGQVYGVEPDIYTEDDALEACLEIIG